MSKKVFLVDDDVDLVNQNKLVLSKKGYEVSTAFTANEALTKLEADQPDIMILDVMMEHRTAGFVLAREIGKKYSDIPIIIMSGDTEKANWMGEENNTWDQIVKFLEKPVSPDELSEAIEKVLK